MSFDTLPENTYTKAIRKHFPTLSHDEIESANVGHMLRGMLKDEDKIKMFPSKNELQFVFAQTTLEALGSISFEYKKTGNQLKRKSKEYEDIIGFYVVRSQTDPTYSKRFLWLEKLIKKWVKAHGIADDNIFKLSHYYPLTYQFEHKMTLKSYSDLAEQFYPRLKFLIEEVIPEIETLIDIQTLNQRINYGNHGTDRFSGLARGGDYDKRRILVNPVVSILSGDPNCDEIIEKEVMQYTEDNAERIAYQKAFEELKNNTPEKYSAP